MSSARLAGKDIGALTVAGIAGAGTMVVELAAVRLLAPYFGTSLVVWTNVIAVILLALALGYLVGGRLAARREPLAVLAVTLGSAGAWVAWLPFLGAWLARLLLPESIALHEAADLITWGSLAVSLAVFLPPAVMLGTTCPLVVESMARGGASAGRAGGLVLCVSTVGSLLGVFATSHLLLPGLGIRGTHALASACLLLSGLVAWGIARKPHRTLGCQIVLALLAASSWWPSSPPGKTGARRELASRESSYQSLRVVEESDAHGRLRMLQVNEGFDSFQSVWQPEPGLLPAGFYYNDFLLPLGWVEAPGEWNVLVLGLGAGTVVRVFAAEPELEARFVGVELDPEVVDLGRRFFELPSDEELVRTWSGMDARVALSVTSESFQQIVLDCYSNQIEIPPHLCTLEFFVHLKQRLSPGGWLTANLGGFGFEDPVVAAVAGTCARAFDAPVLLVRVPHSRNFMLLARREAPLPFDGIRWSAALRKAPLSLGPRALPGFARLVSPAEATRTLRDDWCPIEELQRASIAQAKTRRSESEDS